MITRFTTMQSHCNFWPRLLQPKVSIYSSLHFLAGDLVSGLLGRGDEKTGAREGVDRSWLPTRSGRLHRELRCQGRRRRDVGHGGILVQSPAHLPSSGGDHRGSAVQRQSRTRAHRRWHRRPGAASEAGGARVRDRGYSPPGATRIVAGYTHCHGGARPGGSSCGADIPAISRHVKIGQERRREACIAWRQATLPARAKWS